MAVQVNPITQSLPATTAIQDPATRRFAQAVEDALRALRSEEGAVESLKKAADAMNGAVAGGTPPSIAQWLFSSELYQKLTTEIARVDTQAKQDVLDEALARQTAIDEINATLATIQSTAAYDLATTYAVGDMVTYDGKLYQAVLETTGNLPTNTTYWKKVGDYATLGDVVAAHTLEIDDLDSRVTTNAGNLTAEIASRQALATQVRGSYTGTDVNQVSQGLIYSERVARATADSNEVAARQSLSAKLLGATSPDGLTLETLSEGLIFDERQARVSGDGANASSISALRAQVGVTEAGALTTGLILDEKNVRASNDLAIVSAVNTALAQITGVSTSISQSGENLIANWTQAQATKWSQIEAEVLTAGGQTIRAALQQESNARSTLAGQVSASWMVKAEVDVGTGKPYVAGIALGAEGQGGAATSEFIIRADKFAVVMPGYGEHVPFAIGPSGASFVGAQNTSGVAQPFEGWSLGSQSLVSVSDGKVGNTVLRLGAAASYPTQTSFVPIDPTKKYRVRFWARPSSDCNGLLYFSLRQAVNETGAWGPVNGGRAPYAPSAQTRAAHNATYGTDVWGEYSYIWDATDWQAGVKFFRPEFLNNYNGTAGYWEVQGLVIEEATDVEAAKDAASAAQLAANTANNTLADIASDNKLTPVEKQSAANEWGIINRERASIQAQASALGISSELNDYNYTYAVLNDYITPLLADLQNPSAIDGPTFRDKWSYFYEYRQRLMNKMSAVAATKADWASVQGSGKPEDGATVGANSSNLRAGVGVNMVFNGDYTDGLAGTVLGWRDGGNQHYLGWNLPSYTVQGEGTAYIHQPGTNGTAVFDANIWNGAIGQFFAVTPGQRYEFYVYLNTHRCRAQFGPVFYDAAGNDLLFAQGTSVSHESGISTISDMRISHGFVVAPANAVRATLIVRGYGINSSDPYVFFSRVYFGMASAGQTEVSPWSPGRGISQITPSNVTTYIANAAIGNAQIASAAITNAKIGDLAVTTAKIGDNAVTIPVSAYTVAGITVGTAWVTIQSVACDPEGGSVSLVASATASSAYSAAVAVRLIAPSGAQIGYASTTIGYLYSEAGGLCLTARSTQAGVYLLQGIVLLGANISFSYRSLVAIGSKK